MSASAVTTELAADPRLPHRDTLLDSAHLVPLLREAHEVLG